MQQRLVYLVMTISLFIIEYLIATVWNHNHFVRAYWGDFLVVILLYTFIKIFWNIAPKVLALSIFIFSVFVEIAQYFHLADHLQLTEGSIARIVVGTSFSWIDILMYALGCLVIYLLDKPFYKPLKYPLSDR
jgi:hypothetical protein